MSSAIKIISFGYLHGPSPTADLTLDVRSALRDPAVATELLDLSGLDRRVQQTVLTTPGALTLLTDTIAWADRSRTIAFGCAGGRHRAPALAEAAAQVLNDHGHHVTVEHRHVHLARVLGP